MYGEATGKVPAEQLFFRAYDVARFWQFSEHQRVVILLHHLPNREELFYRQHVFPCCCTCKTQCAAENGRCFL